MLQLQKYVRPQSLQEAYDLIQKRNFEIIGGMLWLKMQNRTLTCGVDLSDLGLDTIEETDDEFIIGAMTSLRQLEMHDSFNSYTNNAMKESVRHIVGVQFRNLATVGGSLFGRYGFSDVLTLFMALDAKVELFHGGIMSVEEFSKTPYTKDILVRVIVKKVPLDIYYTSHRQTKTDFPVLTCCMSKRDGDYVCVIGARPGRAMAQYDQNNILSSLDDHNMKAFARYVSDTIPFQSNMRGSEAYRQRLCRSLVKRALNALKKGESSC